MATGVYPGFATDLQAQFMSLMALADSSSVITENIFENSLCTYQNYVEWEQILM